MYQRFMDSYEARIEAGAQLRDAPTSTGIEGPRPISQSLLRNSFEHAPNGVSHADCLSGAAFFPSAGP